MKIEDRILARKIKELKKNSSFYKDTYKEIQESTIVTLKDIEQLPFIDKEDLRKYSYAEFGILGEGKVSRIHSTSGTTGKSIIIPYTKKDLNDWNIILERCLRIAKIDENDTIQIATGFGLWTAGIAFQTVSESIGALAVPTGAGNSYRQIEFLEEMGSTILCSTSSFALLLSEKIKENIFLKNHNLKKIILGSEILPENMYSMIKNNLGVEVFDIYGLTEIYGPGIGISCSESREIHYFNDYFYFEIIDPITNEVLPDGQIGELVITTLKKEAMPLFRYRTHDLTYLSTEPCKCGCAYPKIGKIIGRTDDMIKIRGVKVFPQQFETIINKNEKELSEYRITMNREWNKEVISLEFETNFKNEQLKNIENDIKKNIKNFIGVKCSVKGVPSGYLPRFEKKAKRIIDLR